MNTRSIARTGHKISLEGKAVGRITSGSWSPTLKEAIALAYVPKETGVIGQELTVSIRGKEQQARVVKKPFYKKGL